MSYNSGISPMYQKYLDTIANKQTAATLKCYALFGNYDYSAITKEEMVEILLNANPLTYRSAKSAIQALKRYLIFLDEQHGLSVLAQIDSSEFAKHVASTAPCPYFSESEFEGLLQFIDLLDSPNMLYLRSFVRACFEGIYSEDLSVLINLKARDINGNIVTLYNLDDEPYQFEISHDLAFDLIELSRENKWYRRNRHDGFSGIKMNGLEPDTCFKSKSYTDLDDINKVQLSYWRITRTLSEEYGRKFSPKTLFISGLLCRIKRHAADFGLTLQDIIKDTSNDSIGVEIIRQEFDRCRYYVSLPVFQVTVMNALDNFNDE